MKLTLKNKGRHLINLLVTMVVSLAFVVAVVAALNLTGVWALILGFVTGVVAVQIQLHIYPFEFEVIHDD